jgi:hypothetical protein
MNAGTCWGKNTIDPSGRGIEKPRTATLTFFTPFFTPLLNLRSLILGLTPFGWLPSITLNPVNSIIMGVSFVLTPNFSGKGN